MLSVLCVSVLAAKSALAESCTVDRQCSDVNAVCLKAVCTCRPGYTAQQKTCGPISSLFTSSLSFRFDSASTSLFRPIVINMLCAIYGSSLSVDRAASPSTVATKSKSISSPVCTRPKLFVAFCQVYCQTCYRVDLPRRTSVFIDPSVKQITMAD